MAYQWADLDRGFITARYDRIAGLIPLIDWLLFLPQGLRKSAAESLNLKPGECMLEVGCGTGRNFPYLQQQVGPQGRIYGVDLSSGMLGKARELRHRQHWNNIHLAEGDAADYQAPEPLDGVLFSLSYNTMPHHFEVLLRAWEQLRPGGRLVIMDAKLPPGRFGQFILPFSLWLMRRTMLGNPLIRPWLDLPKITTEVVMTEYLFGSYYVCYGIKP